MILSNQLNWNDGAIEDSHLDVTDWTFEEIEGKMILFRTAIHQYPSIVSVYRNETGYHVEMEFQGAITESPHQNLAEAFQKIEDMHTAMGWTWAKKAIGHLRSTIHTPIDWQDENGIWAARTANYYATATEETGTLTIYLQGERMFYRRVTGTTLSEVKQQIQDMLNQKRFEVGQLVEEL